MTTSTQIRSAIDQSLGDLDSFIVDLLSDWKIPGLALAAVQEGRVVVAKGYGFRHSAKRLPVTPRTLFAIASLSKCFTTTALGILVDEGKVDWDNPVRQYLPEFWLHDPVATEHTTLRDLLCHRTGLPQHDAIWYCGDLERSLLLQRLRFLEPSTSFRSAFQYQNLMYIVAGEIVVKLSGLSWETFIRDRIFRPIGMKRSTCSVTDPKKCRDFAVPYVFSKGRPEEVPFFDVQEASPCAGINSNVEDLIPYLLCHMNKGKVHKTGSARGGAKRIISEATAEELQSPQVVMSRSSEYDEFGHFGYGLGFVITTYRGHKYVCHSGTVDGFTAVIGFLPNKRIGVIALSNLYGVGDENPVPVLATLNLFDKLLGLDQIPWNARTKEAVSKSKVEYAQEQLKKRSIRKKRTRPSHKLADYAGEYKHPGYGHVHIMTKRIKKKDQLVMKFGRVKSVLKHFHYNVFDIPECSRNFFWVSQLRFFYGWDGDIDKLSMSLESEVDDIVFTRVRKAK